MKKIILLLLLLPVFAQAQMTYTGGPLNTNGQCQALWARNDSALMGFEDGLYRTLNGGHVWTLLSNGIPNNADPRTIEYSNGVLIVGTNDGARIYRSTDFGDSFTGGTGAITAIAIPTASTAGPNFSAMGGTTFDPHIYDFTNQDWTSTGNGGITHGMRYMGGDSVWICSGSVTSGTTKYSHDGGTTWSQVANEPQTDVGGGVILSSVAQDFLKVGGRILVGTNLTGFPVLFTDDYGQSWSAGNLPLTTWSDYGKRFIRVHDNHILTVNLSGVWKSTDRGLSWTMIQALPQIRTMVLWKNGHLLVGTDNGVCEFANYGDGPLLKKHGIPGNPSNLITANNGNILAGTRNGIQQYHPGTGNWSRLQDTSANGQPFAPLRLARTADTIFAFTANSYLTSGDQGATFRQMSNQPSGGQNLSMVAPMAGKKFAASFHSGGGSPQQPRIYSSSNNGGTYTQASFSNSISYGLGGAGGNYVEHFLETPNALIADMNAGFAISTDGGANWTFSGGVWDRSFLAVAGNDIYHFKVAGAWQDQKSLEVSTDNGATWSAVPLTGLPNFNAPNFKGYWGVWNLNGKICTYNAHENPRGIYEWDPGNSQWTLIPGSAASLEDWDGITDMHFDAGVYYANWLQNGTWRVGGAVGIHSDLADKTGKVALYPNPCTNIVTMERESTQAIQLQVVNVQGQIVAAQVWDSYRQSLDVAAYPRGLYFFRFTGNEGQFVYRVMKE